MKMSELFQKMGFDMNRDVELPNTDTTQQIIVPTQEQQLQQPTQEQPIQINTPSSTVEQQIQNNNQLLTEQLQTTQQLQNAQKEIEDLKKMNFALLQQTPVSQEENLTIEDRIYRSVIGKPKEV